MDGTGVCPVAVRACTRLLDRLDPLISDMPNIHVRDELWADPPRDLFRSQWTAVVRDTCGHLHDRRALILILLFTFTFLVSFALLLLSRFAKCGGCRVLQTSLHKEPSRVR